MSKFNKLSTAKSWVQNSPLALVVMHGDDGLFWVVSGRKSRELETAGYERA
jgi:hypothetical protein